MLFRLFNLKESINTMKKESLETSVLGYERGWGANSQEKSDRNIEDTLLLGKSKWAQRKNTDFPNKGKKVNFVLADLSGHGYSVCCISLLYFKWKKKRRNKKEKKWTWLFLGVVEEKDFCRYVGEHRQRQQHLGEYRVDMTKLSWAVWGEAARRRDRNQLEQPGDQGYKESG